MDHNFTIKCFSSILLDDLKNCNLKNYSQSKTLLSATFNSSNKITTSCCYVLTAVMVHVDSSIETHYIIHR